MPDQKATTPPSDGIIPADADDRRGNSREEPVPTNQDLELALQILESSTAPERLAPKDYFSLGAKIGEALAQARRKGREEAVETMKPELYRLAGVETRARRAGGNIRAWAQDARRELEKPGGDRHAAGHLCRIIEDAERLIDQPAPEEHDGPPPDYPPDAMPLG